MLPKIFRSLGGRTMTFVWVALGMGFALALIGKLTSEFVALESLLAGVAAGRALGQDRLVNGSGSKGEGGKA